MKRTRVFQVILEQDEAGCFVAECPALKARCTHGKTYQEAIENIKDAIGLCLPMRSEVEWATMQTGGSR